MSPAPTHPLLARADKLFQSGQWAAAAAEYTKILKANPNKATLWHRLGVSQAAVGDYASAIRSVERALKVRPDTPLYLVDLGQFYTSAGRYADAERTLDRVLTIEPDLAFAMGSKIELYQHIGEFEKAQEQAERAIAAFPNDVRLIVAYAKLAPRIKQEERAVQLIERILEDESLKGEPRMIVLFRLANLLDRLKRYDEAFARAAEANAMHPAKYDAALNDDAVDRTIASWTADRVRSLPHASQRSELPVFIVGIFRSGTSLVEQILSCHPKVHGAGELTDIATLCARIRGPFRTQEPLIEDPAILTTRNLEQARREYLATLYRLGGKASRVTDKMPANSLRLGLIDRMLPGARVIHCIRNPLDTLLSCWFQNLHGHHPWMYRMEHLAAFYRTYWRLIEHWKRVLDLPILEVVYEELTADPETQIPRLVEFLGLEWDDACLSFHASDRVTRTVSNEQVRQPMYRSSVERWRNYEQHLAPLRAALGDLSE